MEEIENEIRKRDRRRKYLSSLKTPEEHLAEMFKLQQITWDLLRANPAGYAHFMRRNFKKRAIPVRGDDVSQP